MNGLQENLIILQNDIAWGLQKLGIILESKMPLNFSVPILDFEVSIQGDWMPWSAKVPQMEVETHKVASPDVVVPTLDTVRHEALLYTWLADHKPMGM